MDGQRNNYRINDPNRRPMVDIRIPNYNTKLEDLYAQKKENVVNGLRIKVKMLYLGLV